MSGAVVWVRGAGLWCRECSIVGFDSGLASSIAARSLLRRCTNNYERRDRSFNGKYGASLTRRGLGQLIFDGRNIEVLRYEIDHSGKFVGVIEANLRLKSFQLLGNVGRVARYHNQRDPGLGSLVHHVLDGSHALGKDQCTRRVGLNRCQLNVGPVATNDHARVLSTREIERAPVEDQAADQEVFDKPVGLVFAAQELAAKKFGYLPEFRGKHAPVVGNRAK